MQEAKEATRYQKTKVNQRDSDLLLELFDQAGHHRKELVRIENAIATALPEINRDAIVDLVNDATENEDANIQTLAAAGIVVTGPGI